MSAGDDALIRDDFERTFERASRTLPVFSPPPWIPRFEGDVDDVDSNRPVYSDGEAADDVLRDRDSQDRPLSLGEDDTDRYPGKGRPSPAVSRCWY